MRDHPNQTMFRPMNLNSDKSLALARAVLREHGGQWENVKASGRVREDGVIVLKRPRQSSQDRRTKG